MSEPQSADGSQAADRQVRIRRAVDDVIRRRAAGEPVTDEQIAAEYDDLQPELGDELAELALIEQALVQDYQAEVETASIKRPAAHARSASAITIDGYRALREVKRGGQAVVFRAVQESTGRKVAVKVMREGPLASPQHRARFEREAQILAALDHPNIVSILDRGRTADGSFFLTMDYIEGRSLDEHVRGGHDQTGDSLADPAELMRLFLKIADAVNVAHLRGIVHRDLKPSNILIDGRGEPHVLDFGLARTALGPAFNKADTEPVTITGQFLGSLPWASPEQAEGKVDQVDIRSDVYSLGVLLYQMLTGGAFPYKVVGTMREVLDNIVNAQPTPPSQALQTKSLRSVRRRGRFRRRKPINETIEAIVLKALAKSPENRYQSAGEFARDVGNYLSGRPTTAAGTAALYRQHHLRRYHAAAIAGVVLLCCGVTALVSWWLPRPADTSSPPTTISLLRPAEPEPSPADAVVAPTSKPVDEPLTLKPSAGPVATVGHGEPLSRRAIVTAPAPLPDVRGWTLETRRNRGKLQDSAYDPEGTYLATASYDGTIRLYDPDTGRLLRALIGINESHPMIIVSADGRYIAALSGFDSKCIVWEAGTGRRVQSLESVGERPAFSMDGRWIGWGERRLELRNVESGRPVSTQLGALSRDDVINIAFGPDGAIAATSHIDYKIRLWRLDTGELVRTLEGAGDHYWNLLFSPDGARLVSVDRVRGAIYLWDLSSGKPPQTLAAEGKTVRTGSPIDISPDSLHLVVADLRRGGTVGLWEAQSGAFIRWLTSTGGDVDFSPDGKSVALSGYYNSVLIEDRASGSLQRTIEGTWCRPRTAAISRDSTILVCGGRAGYLTIWDLASGLPPKTIGLTDEREITHVALTPDGRLLAAGTVAGMVRIWDLTLDELRTVHQWEGPIKSLAFSSDGSLLAGLSGTEQAHTIHVVDPRRGVERAEHIVESLTHAVALDAKGTIYAAAGAGEAILVWNLDTPIVRHELVGHESPVRALAMTGDGKRLASVDEQGQVRIWDMDSGQLLTRYHHPAADPQGSEKWRVAAVWSSDGRTLTTIRSTSARRWDDASAAVLDTSHGFVPATGEISAPSLSPHGDIVMSPSQDFLRLWDPGTGQTLLTLMHLHRTMTHVHDEKWLIVSPDGHYRGSAGIETEIVYVVETDKGQQTLTPAEFAGSYGWENDPKRARLPERLPSSGVRRR